MKCQGFNVSGYNKNTPCCNDGKFEYNGKNYCTSHYTIAVKQPERFTKAEKAWEKYLKSREEREKLKKED